MSQFRATLLIRSKGNRALQLSGGRTKTTMAVHRVRLVGASTKGARTAVPTVGNRTEARDGSGHPRAKEETRATRIANALRRVLTATAPIQCPCVRSRTNPQAGQASRICNHPALEGLLNKPRPPHPGQAANAPRTRTLNRPAPSTRSTVSTQRDSPSKYYRSRR